MSYEAWEETYNPIENPFAPGSQLFQIPCTDEERELLMFQESGATDQVTTVEHMFGRVKLLKD